MPNPFCVPGRTHEEPGPLCPWAHGQHSEYYVPVDNTDKVFQEFKDRLVQLNPAVNAAEVLVHGESGCGKVSVIHRCAWHETQQLGAGVGKIVDLCSEQLAGQSLVSQRRFIVNMVYDYIQNATNFLPSTVVARLPRLDGAADEGQIQQAMSVLSLRLRRASRQLVLLQHGVAPRPRARGGANCGRKSTRSRRRFNEGKSLAHRQ